MQKGGYYGTGIGRRGGTVSHFMLGVAVKEGENTNPVKYFLAQAVFLVILDFFHWQK